MSAIEKKRVVLLVGSEGDAPQGAVLGSESTPLGALLAESDGPTVEVVSLGVARVFADATTHIRLDVVPLGDRLLRAVGAYALRSRFDAFPIGRLLNSIGPVAPSRVFWRALKHHPDAVHLLQQSDVAIASDLETTKAAWIAVRRGWVSDAYYDHRALALASQRPSST